MPISRPVAARRCEALRHTRFLVALSPIAHCCAGVSRQEFPDVAFRFSPRFASFSACRGPSVVGTCRIALPRTGSTTRRGFCLGMDWPSFRLRPDFTLASQVATAGTCFLGSSMGNGADVVAVDLLVERFVDGKSRRRHAGMPGSAIEEEKRSLNPLSRCLPLFSVPSKPGCSATARPPANTTVPALTRSRATTPIPGGRSCV